MAQGLYLEEPLLRNTSFFLTKCVTRIFYHDLVWVKYDTTNEKKMNYIICSDLLAAEKKICLSIKNDIAHIYD